MTTVTLSLKNNKTEALADGVDNIIFVIKTKDQNGNLFDVSNATFVINNSNVAFTRVSTGTYERESKSTKKLSSSLAVTKDGLTSNKVSFKFYKFKVNSTIVKTGSSDSSSPKRSKNIMQVEAYVTDKTNALNVWEFKVTSQLGGIFNSEKLYLTKSSETGTTVASANAKGLSTIILKYTIPKDTSSLKFYVNNGGEYLMWCGPMTITREY